MVRKRDLEVVLIKFTRALCTNVNVLAREQMLQLQTTNNSALLSSTSSTSSSSSSSSAAAAAAVS